jgi:predicted nucleic acid-binding Zn ribbon protein
LATETGDARHLRILWELAVGPVIARQSSPVSLRDGIVVVKVGSARWKAELEQREAELRSRLLQHLGDVRVTRLQFTLDAWGR